MKDEISYSELLEAINKGFSHMEERMATKDDLEKLDIKIDKVEERLSQKIDGLTRRLDNEIIRYTDGHVDHEKRITLLEEHVFES